MSRRPSSSFAPKTDEFTSFNDELLVEEQKGSNRWFSNAAKFLLSSSDSQNKKGTSDQQFHELMVSVLNDKNMKDIAEELGGVKGLNAERYILLYLPSHFIRAEMFDEVSSILQDSKFMNLRILTLGTVEATKRLTNDLTYLRRQYSKKSKDDKPPNNTKGSEEGRIEPTSSDLDQLKFAVSTSIDTSVDSPPTLVESNSKITFDVTRMQRESCRKMIDAVRRAESDLSVPSSDKAINTAICLSVIGEFLLQAKILRDAIKWFEESLDLFRNLLGKRHIEVARALNGLARAYIKSDENSKALTKLDEAHRIYGSCDKLHHYDAISNNLLIATLLVDNRDWENATLKYDEVIQMKQQVYGNNSVSVAKTINAYAIILAKHNRMSESLRQYEAARNVYVSINTLSPPQDKYSFDITLIELNIASIKSKLGNYQGALESYERGVEGLRLQIKKETDNNDGPDNARLMAQKRHLVSAMGRIGSMRMKLKDNAGALKAYLTLIKEVDKKSPTPSQMEKARAHVKCATIFRQAGTKENNGLAITHLNHALQMYTILHGANHKDTKAIGSSLRQWQKTDAALES